MIDLKKDLKPCDIICFYQNPQWWDVVGWAVQRGIQQDSKNYLSGNSDWYSPHIELVFAPDAIYRAVPPKIAIETVDDIIKRGDRVKVFRPTFYNFTEADGHELLKTFESSTDYASEGITKKEVIIGDEYDTDTDLMIGLNSFLFGSPNSNKVSLGTGSQLICSAGTALAYEYFRMNHGQPYPKLFSKIQPDAFKTAWWRNEIIGNYMKGNQLQILDTIPAHFANTQTHFNKEFVLVGSNF
jgi:hypothetical protein